MKINSIFRFAIAQLKLHFATNNETSNDGRNKNLENIIINIFVILQNMIFLVSPNLTIFILIECKTCNTNGAPYEKQ